MFSILGTTYGGDGRTSFALPDLRGRTPIHAGTGPGLSTRKIGQRSGTEINILNITQIPQHSHNVTEAHLLTATSATGNTPVNSYPAPAAGRTTDGTSVNISGWGTSPDGAKAATNGVRVTVGNTGSNQFVNNMQPWECVNYIIAMQGTFPSRS